PAALAEREYHLAVRRELDHLVLISVTDEDVVVRSDVDAVGVAQAAFSPAREEIPVGVEDEDGGILSLVEVHAVARVDGDVTHDAERHPGRENPPRTDDVVDVLPGTDDEPTPAAGHGRCPFGRARLTAGGHPAARAARISARRRAVAAWSTSLYAVSMTTP